MKEAIVNTDISVTVKDSPVPTPGPGELLVKVIVSGTNPKDWKLPHMLQAASNSGDDVAGTVEAVGAEVYEFAKGDRVAGFHVMRTEHGSFAEYAIVPAFSTFHIPRGISYEEAATVPLAAYTAATALFHSLELPSPWDRTRAQKTPVIIYGVSTAIGAFGVKLAKKAGLHPLIAVGSKNSAFVTPLLEEDKGDVFLDYTQFDSQDKLAEKLREVIKDTGLPCFRVFDTVSEKGSFEMLGKAIAGPPEEGTGFRPRVTTVLPGKDFSAIDKSVEVVVTMVGHVHEEEGEGRLFGLVWARVFAEGLRTGWMKAHPYEVIEGLQGVERALKGLQNGTVRAKKMVIRVAEGN
ncbi:Alcohol dehydrogenase GroES-like domain-containing protein [Colletotrichum higginsianum IMI 349063]|uniref:Alcohol dehydrogenase GroES-like domain-containing protein n=2 Tax=Colletotrichum higginsianum TaxID=80884 RepID=A0A1B7XX88_COLHI|nr:Alcohol dehydrogenase GroES-like domain-containing protein [Colletotrichum higginsianum IMI 349063]OBR04387.1 Alcohol dehydrogenase GroES-like domain-containing protein [Colletotrichum higginsianum IMI 349063]TIC89652.1 Protein TOXD [Colletotrichum higginsianum]